VRQYHITELVDIYFIHEIQRKAAIFLFQDNNKTEDAKFMFQFVAEAYEVLTDEEKRKNYDLYGTVASTTGGQSSGPQRPFYHQNYNSEELYKKIFGEAGKVL
jgi:DnaJ-class molecular chaperone